MPRLPARRGGPRRRPAAAGAGEPRPVRRARTTASTSSPATTGSRSTTSSPTTASTTRPTARATGTGPTTTGRGTAGGRATTARPPRCWRCAGASCATPGACSCWPTACRCGAPATSSAAPRAATTTPTTRTTRRRGSTGSGGRRSPTSSASSPPCWRCATDEPVFAAPGFWGDDVRWFGARRPARPRPSSRSLAWQVGDLYVMANAWWEPLTFDVQAPWPVGADRRHRPGRRPTTSSPCRPRRRPGRRRPLRRRPPQPRRPPPPLTPAECSRSGVCRAKPPERAPRSGAREDSGRARGRLHPRSPRGRAAQPHLAHGGELGRLPPRRTCVPALDVLDLGCGPGTITIDLAAPGRAGAGARPRPVGRRRRAGGRRRRRRRRRRRPVRGRRRLCARVAGRGRSTSSTPTRCCSTSPTRCERCAEALAGARAPAGCWPCATPTTPASPGRRGMPRLDRWLALYHELTARNGAEADAGRFLPAWVRRAGFDDVVVDELDVDVRRSRVAAVVGRAVGRPRHDRRRSPTRPSSTALSDAAELAELAAGSATGPPIPTPCSSSRTSRCCRRPR